LKESGFTLQQVVLEGHLTCGWIWGLSGLSGLNFWRKKMEIEDQIKVSQFQSQVCSLGLNSGLSDTLFNYALSKIVTRSFEIQIAFEKSELTKKGEENDC
jgi:hypothetical protein